MLHLKKLLLLKDRLHILFLNSWYPSRVLPTNGDFIQRHAKAVSLKHKVSVLHIITDKNLEKDIEIVFEKQNELESYIAYIKPVKNSLKKGLLFFKAYKKILKKIGNFDLVHLNTLYPFGVFALHLKWFYKKPFIISEHWTGYHLPQSKEISFYQKSISKIITKSSSFICPVSNNLGDAMQKLRFKGNYQRVPNVVNTEIFVPKEVNRGEFTILHISSMVDEHKNISGIVRVISKLQKHIPKFKIKFIGAPATNMQLLAKKLAINPEFFEFIDQIPQPDIVGHLQQAHGLLLFSNYENLPCVILEAFSCGIPVISTDIGGIKEYFPTEFGFLIERKNENELLEKILDLYNKPVVNTEKMHNYAVTNFSQDTIAESFSNLYYQALKN